MLTPPGLVPLSFDPSLVVNTGPDVGRRALWPPFESGWSDWDVARGVYPYYGGFPLYALRGYYLVVLQFKTLVSADGWRWWLTRIRLDGSTDTSFGSNGWMLIPKAPSQPDPNDVIIANGRVYTAAGAGNMALRADCYELQDTSLPKCPNWGWPSNTYDFGTGSGTVTAITQPHLAYYAGHGLYIAAVIALQGTGELMSVLKMKLDNDHAPDPAFGVNGYWRGTPRYPGDGFNRAAIRAIAVGAGGYVFVGGSEWASNEERQTVLYTIPATTAAPIQHLKRNPGYPYNADGDTEITALSATADGDIVYAGRWASGQASEPMFVGRYRASDGATPSVCLGAYGACQPDPPWTVFGVTYRPHSVPVGIVQRGDNGDLVVLQSFSNSGSFGDGHTYNLLQELSHDASTVIADSAIGYDYQSQMSGTGRNSAPVALMAAPRLMSGGEDSPTVIAVAGYRQWSTVDYDATLTVFSTDRIFVDDFGGAP
ncbi:MAG: hypothetical protein K8F35_12665 [Dokdonella sp.]|uniref:hypothetical protein n=1 Tax=Dokdonella sp. TaxID=2291710 RepID=UPI0025BD71BA|nr:hypothetical protein [Dokdonella sp.]MBZ0223868.1 hypothetical protein [Dokdonella sp.]